MDNRNNNSNNLYQTPDPFAPKNVKDSDEYAKQVVNYILGTTKDYRERRNDIFYNDRLYAEGKQPVDYLLDQLDINGKPTYTNIRFKPTPISKKFERVVVDGYMLEKHEFVNVKSISKHIIDRKAQARSEALFRMDQKQFLAQLSQETGFPVEDPNAFVPESVEELDIYTDLNDKEQEELLMQDTITFLLNNADIESMKRNILRELYQVNLVGLYSYIDNKGRWVVDQIKGEDCIYSYTHDDCFKDLNFAGRIVRMSVSSLRRRFAIKDEKAFYESIRKSRIRSGASNIIGWSDSFRNMRERPYDNLTVELVHVWFKCSKVLEYTKGYDRYGRKVFDIEDFNGTYDDMGTKSLAGGRKMKGQTTPETAYEGYIMGANGYVLEWGEQKNIGRDQTNGDIVCPFIFHMADNNMEMLSSSSVNMIKANLENMDLAIHKIKQAIAKSAPDGLIIDVDALDAIDLGTGGELTPLTIMQIYRQTGDLYYRGKDEAGNPNQIPVRPSISSIASTLESYMAVYNFELNQIRDILGINEIRDGSATSPRISFKFAQGQQEASNTATYSLYRGYLKMITELVRQSGIKVWDNLKYGSAENSFLKFLGTKNAELIKKKIDINQCAFEFSYDLTMTDEEAGNLEQNITTCLANGTLEMQDAIMIRDTKDFKIAQRTLAYVLEKRRKQRNDEAQENARLQAEQSAQAGAQVEQVKQQGDQMRAQLEMSKEKTRGENDMILKMADIAKEVISSSLSSGKPIPPEYLGLVDLVFQNAGVKTAKSAKETEDEIVQQQQAEMQQAQIQQLEQAVQNGEITPEEAEQMIQQGGGV